MLVFIVDDQPLTRRGIKSMVNWDELGLTLAGEASNGVEALQFIEKSPPDILITDVRMPLMSGLELAQYMHDHFPATKTLVISGYNDFEYVKAALKTKVHDYILKPIDESELNSALSSAKRDIRAKNPVPLSESVNSFVKPLPWSYPLETEKLLIQSVHYGEKEQLSTCYQSFVSNLASAQVSVGETRIWIGQLVMQCYKTLSIHLPQDLAIEGLLLADSFYQKEDMKEIQTGAYTYLDKVADFYNKQKKVSYKGAIMLSKHYIDTNFGENITLQQMSAKMYTSPSQFSSLFKEFVGDTFINYLTRVRMEQAKRLLSETNLKIDKIAAMVGYPDDSYFRKLFKRLTHMTALEYREMHPCSHLNEPTGPN